MDSNTSIKIIDYVLNIIYKQYNRNGITDGELYGLLVRDYKELDGQVYTIFKLKSTLKTLEKEGFIYSEVRKNERSMTKKDTVLYFLSLDGELLIERGGYTEKLNDIIRDKKKTEYQYVFNLTVAVSSALVFIVALFDYFKKDEVKILQPQTIQIKIIDTVVKKEDTVVVYLDSPNKKPIR
ncbi:MAG: hypothetical protein WCP74_01730 [Sphingobacteriia bacterium]|jgi:hypothetical protein